MVRRTRSERTVSNIVCDAENANSGEHLGLPRSDESLGNKEQRHPTTHTRCNHHCENST